MRLKGLGELNGKLYTTKFKASAEININKYNETENSFYFLWNYLVLC